MIMKPCDVIIYCCITEPCCVWISQSRTGRPSERNEILLIYYISR